MPEPRTILGVKLTRDRGHWIIEMNVNGQVDSSTIFGCRDGLAPMVTTFLRAEAQIGSVEATTERYVACGPPYIAVTMPSGRVLSFGFIEGYEALSEPPQEVRPVAGG